MHLTLLLCPTGSFVVIGYCQAADDGVKDSHLFFSKTKFALFKPLNLLD